VSQAPCVVNNVNLRLGNGNVTIIRDSSKYGKEIHAVLGMQLYSVSVSKIPI